jgi:transcriptional regulator with XRE-family HTH domain
MGIDKIGKLIAEKRQFHKLKQEDLSEISGINIRTISQIEKGDANPSLNTLIRLADVLGLEVILQMKTMS